LQKISNDASIGKRICRGSKALAGYTPVNGQSIKEVGADQSSNPLNQAKSSLIKDSEIFVLY